MLCAATQNDWINPTVRFTETSIHSLSLLCSFKTAGDRVYLFKTATDSRYEKNWKDGKGLYLFSVNSFKFVCYKDANVELKELGN